MLVLVLEHLEQIVVHQKVVELLEFFQRVLIVLTGALRQDVHLEVGLSDLRLISLLVARRILLSLTLEGLIGHLEVVLLGVKAILDNRGTCEESLFQAAECLILDLNGGLLLERLSLVVATFFQDRHQDILLLLLLLIILIILLSHAHLIARLCIDGFFQDALEDLIHVLGASLLVDGLLTLVS